MEVALAFSIIGFSVLPVVGLLPPLLKSEQEGWFNSHLTRLTLAAVAELQSHAYPSSLSDTVELHFTQTGSLTTVPEEVFYVCTATFSANLSQEGTSSTRGEFADPGSDACLATLKWTFPLDPERAPKITQVPLIQKRTMPAVWASCLLQKQVPLIDQ